MLNPVLSDNPALERLVQRTTLPVSAKVAVQFADLCVQWADRRKSRRQLSRLPDAILKDVGLSHFQAAQEFEKPFWRP